MNKRVTISIPSWDILRILRETPYLRERKQKLRNFLEFYNCRVDEEELDNIKDQYDFITDRYLFHGDAISA